MEWHGWPPQVWNGKKWVYIPEAQLIILLTIQLLAARKIIEQLVIKKSKLKRQLKKHK